MVGAVVIALHFYETWQRSDSAYAPVTVEEEASIRCRSPRIIDGDTLHCGSTRIRLLGIDTPEMSECRPGYRCVEGDPHAAKDKLIALSRGEVTCRAVEKDHYGRTVARCEAKGVDFSCAMVASGHAERRYAPLTCP